MADDRLLLEGKVGLVTGGGSGMGRAAALAMARAGASVMLVGRREKLLAEVAAEIEALGARADIHAGDVTQRAVCRDMVSKCVSSLGALDQGGTAYWAHIGGFIFGLLVGILLKKNARKPIPAPPYWN